MIFSNFYNRIKLQVFLSQSDRTQKLRENNFTTRQKYNFS